MVGENRQPSASLNLKVLRTQILQSIKGNDAGKKVSGIKRHITVDTKGLPHAIYITAADVTDRQGALKMIWVIQRIYGVRFFLRLLRLIQSYF